MTGSQLSIGEVARQLGTSTHLLRHWDAEGVVVAARSATGARRYSPEQVDVLRIAFKWQQVGMALVTIGALLSGRPAERAQLVAAAREGLESRRRELNESLRFLDHVLTCPHSVVRACTVCSDFASSSPE